MDGLHHRSQLCLFSHVSVPWAAKLQRHKMYPFVPPNSSTLSLTGELLGFVHLNYLWKDTHGCNAK